METKSVDVIAALDLQPHVEGGYFRRTFQADHRAMLQTTRGPRYLVTSIYYLLTEDSPVGQFHFNQSERLLEGEHGFGLISETVSPGFDFAEVLGTNIKDSRHSQSIAIFQVGRWQFCSSCTASVLKITSFMWK